VRVSVAAPSGFRAARKFLRFVSIYGLGRTSFKAAARLRISPVAWARRTKVQDIAIAGCGQFAYATIAYYLRQAFGRRIAACYDIDRQASESFAAAIGVPRVCDSIEDLIASPGLRTLYIASNHASHADYAAAALARGLDVYVEKPIAVAAEQLVRLLAATQRSKGRTFAGYNRPFAAAVRDLRRSVTVDPGRGISLQCFVSGHHLGAEHWYRRPEEGTRICGNVGHWLDLMIHIFAWRGIPDRFEISLAWANPAEPDDNLNIAITTDRDDVFSVMMTSRSEPFEGINETIHFQHTNTTCKIDDFRRMTLWQGPRLEQRRYWPKDAGHRLAILQPFRQDAGRDWQEVVTSTLLMLHIAQMVRERRATSIFCLSEQRARLASEMATG
jgi:predicted dehydrogenase